MRTHCGDHICYNHLEAVYDLSTEQEADAYIIHDFRCKLKTWCFSPIAISLALMPVFSTLSVGVQHMSAQVITLKQSLVNGNLGNMLTDIYSVC